MFTIISTADHRASLYLTVRLLLALLKHLWRLEGDLRGRVGGCARSIPPQIHPNTHRNVLATQDIPRAVRACAEPRRPASRQNPPDTVPASAGLTVPLGAAPRSTTGTNGRACALWGSLSACTDSTPLQIHLNYHKKVLETLQGEKEDTPTSAEHHTQPRELFEAAREAMLPPDFQNQGSGNHCNVTGNSIGRVN